jgi:hypothetical protein
MNGNSTVGKTEKGLTISFATLTRMKKTQNHGRQKFEAAHLKLIPIFFCRMERFHEV